MPMLHDSDRAWIELGRSTPYYAVCTDERFLGPMTDDARRDFFASGETHVASVIDAIRRRVIPGFEPASALDFGCGVGRLAIPLARQCRRVVGVDVSPAMLDEARRNCDAAGIANVELARALAEVDGAFDLVHSFIVLQHIPVRRGTGLFAELVDRVARGGAGALHVTLGWDAHWARKAAIAMRRNVPLLHNLANVARGWPWSRPLMQMNFYRLEALVGLLRDRGCVDIALDPTDHGGHRGAMLYFRRPA